MTSKLQSPLRQKVDISDAGLAAFTRTILVALAIMFLGWILWNAWHAIPAVDDFCYGAGAQERGIIQNVVNEYFTWGGRFSATVLISAFASIESLLLGHYYLVPLAILTLNLLAAWHFLRAVNLRSPAFFMLFCLMLMATFRMRESLFWLSGGATYGTACALLLALIAEEWKIYSGAVELGAKRVAALALGGFVLAGLNEVASLSHMVLVCLLSGSLLFKQKRDRLYLIAALVTISGTIVAGAAPGNFVRATTKIHDAGILHAVGASLRILISKYAVVIVAHTLVFSIFMWACRIDHRSGPRRSHIVPIVLCLMLALWAGIFPRAYALNDLGPERSRTIDFLFVNLIACLAAIWLNDKRRTRDDARRPILASIIGTVVLATIASFFVLPNATIAPIWSEIQQSAKLRELMDARFELVNRSDRGSLTVMAYTHEPSPITYFNDIRNDAREWENVCFAKYFHLTDVTAQ